MLSHLFLAVLLLVAVALAQRCLPRHNLAAFGNFTLDGLNFPLDDASGLFVPGFWPNGNSSLLFYSYGSLRYWASTNGTMNVVDISQPATLATSASSFSTPTRTLNGAVTFAQLLGNGSRVIQFTASVRGNTSLSSVSSTFMTPVADAAFCSFRVNATFRFAGLLPPVYGVFGGGGRDNASSSIYIVSSSAVASGALSPLGDVQLKVARTGAVALQALSGAVIVAGGCNVTTDGVEAIWFSQSPSNMYFVDRASSNLSVARCFMGIAELADPFGQSIVVLVGGVEQAGNASNLITILTSNHYGVGQFNVQTQSELPKLSLPRKAPVVTFVGFTMIVANGYGNNNMPMTSIEIFDVNENSPIYLGTWSEGRVLSLNSNRLSLLVPFNINEMIVSATNNTPQYFCFKWPFYEKMYDLEGSQNIASVHVMRQNVSYSMIAKLRGASNIASTVNQSDVIFVERNSKGFTRRRYSSIMRSLVDGDFLWPPNFVVLDRNNATSLLDAHWGTNSSYAHLQIASRSSPERDFRNDSFLLIGGTILDINGSSVVQFGETDYSYNARALAVMNKAQPEFTQTTVAGRSAALVVTTPSNFIFVVGGMSADGRPYTTMSVVELTENNAVTQLVEANLSTAHIFGAACAIGDIVFAAGGQYHPDFYYGASRNSSEGTMLEHVDIMSWENSLVLREHSLSSKRSLLACATAADRVFFIGGLLSTSIPTASRAIDVFSLPPDGCASLQSCEIRRSTMTLRFTAGIVAASSVHNRFVVIVGGGPHIDRRGPRATNMIEIFDAITGDSVAFTAATYQFGGVTAFSVPTSVSEHVLVACDARLSKALQRDYVRCDKNEVSVALSISLDSLVLIADSVEKAPPKFVLPSKCDGPLHTAANIRSLRCSSDLMGSISSEFRVANSSGMLCQACARVRNSGFMVMKFDISLAAQANRQVILFQPRASRIGALAALNDPGNIVRNVYGPDDVDARFVTPYLFRISIDAMGVLTAGCSAVSQNAVLEPAGPFKMFLHMDLVRGIFNLNLTNSNGSPKFIFLNCSSDFPVELREFDSFSIGTLQSMSNVSRVTTVLKVRELLITDNQTQAQAFFNTPSSTTSLTQAPTPAVGASTTTLSVSMPSNTTTLQPNSFTSSTSSVTTLFETSSIVVTTAPSPNNNASSTTTAAMTTTAMTTVVNATDVNSPLTTISPAAMQASNSLPPWLPYVLGAVAFLIIVALIIGLFCYSRRQRKAEDIQVLDREMNSAVFPESEYANVSAALQGAQTYGPSPITSDYMAPPAPKNTNYASVSGGTTQMYGAAPAIDATTYDSVAQYDAAPAIPQYDRVGYDKVDIPLPEGYITSSGHE